MSKENLPLTGLPVGRVSPDVLVCGDPGRATTAAACLQNAELISEQREYRAYHGYFEGTAVVICSHGIGAPGAAIAFEELIQAGARRIIRIGTCGALQPHIQSGQLVIATAAVQNTGYGRETVPPGYPAVADLELTHYLRQTATREGYPFNSGIIATRDNFYRGVSTVDNPDYSILSQANVLAVEMECAALFIVGSLRKVRTAAILAVDGNLIENGREDMETYNPHQTAVAAAVAAEIEIGLLTLHNFQHESH